METLKAIKIRRSIRQFTQGSIKKNMLVTLIDAARFAPSARGVQPWEFVILTRKSVLAQIGEFAENARFIRECAACIAVYCSDTKYYLEDGCAATQNILLAAAALGIGSCWVAGDKKPYSGQVSALLGVSAAFKLVSLIALGFPVALKEFRIVEKRSIDAMLHWEKF